MAEYLAPGVYVEEVERGAAPLAGVSTSTAGFLGPTERGPTNPRLLTSFSDFRRLYGGYLEDSYLPTAVNGFFTNGGSRCFLGRVTAADETAEAELADDDPGESATGVVSVEALGPGGWGEHVALIVSNASMHDMDEQLFRLTVRYWAGEEALEDANAGNADPDDDDVPDPDVEEVYDDLSMERRSSNYVEKQVNGTSALIEVTVEEEGERPANSVDDDGSPTDPVWLEGNFDDDESPDVEDYKGSGDDDPEDRTGFAGFEQVSDISIVCLPDEAEDGTLTDELITHCETMDDRFAILQAEQSGVDVGSLMPPDDTDMAAFYYPWLKARNPDTGMVEEIPPGGHVAGYTREATLDTACTKHRRTK